MDRKRQSENSKFCPDTKSPVAELSSVKKNSVKKKMKRRFFSSLRFFVKTIPHRPYQVQSDNFRRLLDRKRACLCQGALQSVPEWSMFGF